MHVKIQSLVSHMAELSAVICLSVVPLDIVCLNETLLYDSLKEVELEGFDIVGRRDRCNSGDKRKCGGVIVFARTAVASHMTLLETSAVSERMWFPMHSNCGLYLLCSWYQPQVQGEVDSIGSLEEEPT